MHLWIIMGLPVAGAVFLIDFLIRRKKWSNNTLAEKLSLIVNMISGIPYLFASALGMLLGISGSGAETAIGNVIYEVTLSLAAIYFIIATAAIVGSVILRKKGKIKASIWINVAALAYIVVVVVANYLAVELL